MSDDEKKARGAEIKKLFDDGRVSFEGIGRDQHVAMPSRVWEKTQTAADILSDFDHGVAVVREQSEEYWRTFGTPKVIPVSPATAKRLGELEYHWDPVQDSTQKRHTPCRTCEAVGRECSRCYVGRRFPEPKRWPRWRWKVAHFTVAAGAALVLAGTIGLIIAGLALAARHGAR